MREIKFRAWVTKDENGDIAEYMEDTIPAWNDPFYEHEVGNIVLMQYTGLKDKNGKEIYEGDIVKGVNRLHECEVEQNVHFLKGCFMFGNWNAHEFFNKHQSIEVIGNIYENPELLEGKE